MATTVYPFNWLRSETGSATTEFPFLIWAEVVEVLSSSSSTSSSEEAVDVIVNATPIDLTVSVVPVTTQLQLNAAPVVVTVSVVQPSLQLQLNATPVDLVVSVVPLQSQIAVNTVPIDLTVSTVPLQTQLEVNVTPIVVTVSTVQPSLQNEIIVNVDPLNLIVSVVPASTQIEVNASPIDLIISIVTPTFEGATVPSVVVTVTAAVVYEHVFDAFNSIASLAASGFVLEDTKIPFTYLSQQANTLGSKYSCGVRHEHGIYQLTSICEDFNELIDIQDELENFFTFKTFLLNSPRLLTLLELQERSIKELEPQLIRGILLYNVIVAKTISTEYCNTITSGETLFHAIHNRFNQFPDIQDFVRDLVCTGFTKESFNGLDHIVLPEVSSTLDFNTSLSKVDSYEVPVTFYSEDLNYLLKIKDAVENVYDYARLVIKGRPGRFPSKHLILDWQSNEIVEIQPQLWCGKVNYNILVESQIDGYFQ